MAIKLNEITYGDFGQCLQLTNGDVDVVITIDMGPRIVRYSIVGGENEFCERPDIVTNPKTGFKLMGGHRLWHSPEHMLRTYEADNRPVRWQETDTGVIVSGSVEPNTGMQKEMEISLEESGTAVYVLHRITNTGLWPVKFAAWSISAMAPGGKEIIPINKDDTELLANNWLALWPYSAMNDSRVWWGSDYISLTQDPAISEPFKVGIKNNQGWAAYFNHGHLFIKQFFTDDTEEYPDGGMNYETYTNDFMVEMETLSPMYEIEPGDCIEHEEIWMLFEDVDVPEDSDESIAEILEDYIAYDECDECVGCHEEGCDCGCEDCDDDDDDDDDDEDEDEDDDDEDEDK